MAKHVVFDIVGTLVCFDAFHQRIEDTIGPKLREHGLNGKSFGHSWMTHAELDFTFLSMSGRHRPYKDVMKSIFYRTLYLSGVEEPEQIATEEERDLCQEGYALLGLREGAKECLDLLKSNGFEVWCLTTADIARVQGYFRRGGVEMPADRFVSCDTQGVAKPALGAYRPVFEKFGKDDQKWFAAAHMWDVSAAVQVGFKGAYSSAYEKYDCSDVFGTVHVMAESLPDMAKKIIEKSG